MGLLLFLWPLWFVSGWEGKKLGVRWFLFVCGMQPFLSFFLRRLSAKSKERQVRQAIPKVNFQHQELTRTLLGVHSTTASLRHNGFNDMLAVSSKSRVPRSIFTTLLPPKPPHHPLYRLLHDKRTPQPTGPSQSPETPERPPIKEYRA